MWAANAVAVRIHPCPADEVVACLAWIDCRLAQLQLVEVLRRMDSSCIRCET